MPHYDVALKGVAMVTAETPEEAARLAQEWAAEMQAVRRRGCHLMLQASEVREAPSEQRPGTPSLVVEWMNTAPTTGAA